MHQNPRNPKGDGRPLPRLVKRLQLLLAALFLTTVGSALALEGSEELTVLQALQDAPDQFSVFLTMMEQAGLTESLQGAGPITVLAPTDAAFEELGETVRTTLQSEPDRAANFLNGLIISGSHMLADLQNATDGSLAPLSGDVYEVETTAGGLMINGVGFDPMDVDNVYSNGVVHVTRSVVLPQDLRSVNDAERDAADGTMDPAEPTHPADAADPTTPIAPAVPPTTAEEPEPTTAFVRVVQLSPASNVDVVLTPEEEGLTTLDLSGIEYGATSGYQAVEPGTYLINATVPDSQDALFDPSSETFNAGNYYTVTISGLQVPSDTEDTDDGEGFGGWLRNLFGGDGNGDALAIRATTYQDEVRTDATDTRVRIIDAAPGSPALDVVVIDANGERSVLANDMTFGDDSGTQNIDDLITGLELTAADSAAVALDLSGHLPLHTDSTVFIIGTSFEGVPIDVLVLPNGPAADEAPTDAR